MRVLQSFLVEGAPGTATPAPPTDATFARSPSPVAAGDAPLAPPPVNAPGAAFVGSLSGGETSVRPGSTGRANPTIEVPGVGRITAEQMKAAQARAQSVIAEALGPADLSHLTPADALAAQARLDAMRSAGRLTNDQYGALTEGLAVLSGLSPG
jgi:hypothetical protein